MEGYTILTCKLGSEFINCFDGNHDREQLKKWASKRILLCPACGKPYEYCHGKVKIPYFRHMDKEKCEDVYSEPETEEHLMGKWRLYEWIKKQNGVTDAYLEGWIPETKQRPDIIFRYYGEKCVIEYQCSPISSEYHERHNLYQSSGIKDVWICGVEKYIQCLHTGNGIKRLNVLEESCKLYFNSKTNQFYKINSRMTKEDFDKILDNKRYKLMKNVNDYVNCNIKKYIEVKNSSLSYDKFYKYPSPTGRRSRKYPYPVPVYKYSRNVSLAECFDLNTLVLKGVI